MEYKEAREYLESLFKFGSVLGLDRMKALMGVLGDPQDDLKYIHLAGTNGKGSTAATCARILEEAGLSVGLYISPYLEEFEERISVNGVPIDKSSMARLMEMIKAAVEVVSNACGESPTEFEAVTALGFTYFAEKGVDVVCLEVGLGGRLDATNVIGKPEVATITSIGFDHMDRLGHTLDRIAFEKAGIIKDGVTVVSAPQRREASRVIEEVCEHKRSHLYLGGRDFSWREVSSGLEGQRFDFSGPFGDINDLYFPLLGRHQQENAATAIMSVQAFAAADGLDGKVHLSADTIRRGLARVAWPGRLEVMRESPTVLLDVAHNEDGARVLSRAVRDLFSGRRIHLVVGLLKDKDVKGFLANLLPLASSVVVSRPDSPRAMEPQDLAEEVKALCGTLPGSDSCHLPVLVERDIPRAVDLALSVAVEDDVVLVTGSFYLVGHARRWLRANMNVPRFREYTLNDEARMWSGRVGSPGRRSL